MSPTVSFPEAMSRSSRRMIFPERVLGSALVKRIDRSLERLGASTISEVADIAAALGD